MALNDLPSSLQSVIQQGYLERQFRTGLEAILGFRAIADREEFPNSVGETVTKTRTGLLPAVTTPMAPASVNDITSGLGSGSEFGVEQYTLGVAQYAAPPLQLNVTTSKVAIDSVFLRNGYVLGENAARSVDTLAQKALYDQYMGGNTRVSTTLGSPATTLHVDDVRGFFNTLNAQGQVVPVSSSNTLAVLVNGDLLTCIGVLADGTAPTGLQPWMANLQFTGSGSNSSTLLAGGYGGYSGTLTFTTNVSTTDGTAGNSVVSVVAPTVIRPYSSSGEIMAATSAAINPTSYLNYGKITMKMVLAAKAQMRANAVPYVDGTGSYHLFVDPVQMTGMYEDPAFQQFFRGKPDTQEYKKGVIMEQLGVRIMETNLNPIQTLTQSGGTTVIHRGVLVGQGALIEGVFTGNAYADALRLQSNGMTTIVDGIAHVTRAPLDVLQQVVTQTWSYIGGFVAPTDTTVTPTTVPTSNNSALKRAIMIESL